MPLFCVIIEWGKTLCCLIKQIIIFFQKQQTARKFDTKTKTAKVRVQEEMDDQMVRHFYAVTLCHNCCYIMS